MATAIDTERDGIIERAVKQFKARRALYDLTEHYYQGDHKMAFATDKFRSAFGSLFTAFADNLCPSVVDAVADKLTLVGFGVEEGEKTVADEAWALWKANRMDRRAGEVHLEALSNGDGYLTIWRDENNDVQFYPQRGNQVTVKYDEENPQWVLWAAKCWMTDDGRCRLTLYYPDRIEKYITPKKITGDEMPTKFNGYIRYDLDNESWPLPNEWQQVPVFHFANNARTGQFGRSELADVIPLQDALNKAVADGLIAQEFLAFPQRYATGLEVDTDPETGQAIAAFKAAIDRLWTSADPNVKFGQFDAADIAKYVNMAESYRTEIARVSRTPLHYILPSGDWPSGEALKTAEAPFTAKVLDRQVAFGNVWEDVLRLALKMQGNSSEFRLTALWKDPAPRSELDFAQVAVIKNELGVPKKQLQEEFGYSPEEVLKFKAEKADEAQAGVDMAAAAFDRGRVPFGQGQ